MQEFIWLFELLPLLPLPNELQILSLLQPKLDTSVQVQWLQSNCGLQGGEVRKFLSRGSG
jgi:hypothetical protein